MTLLLSIPGMFKLGDRVIAAVYTFVYVCASGFVADFAASVLRLSPARPTIIDSQRAVRFDWNIAAVALT
jgi:hypothetical protein